MKKLSCLFLCLILIFSLSACSKESNKEDESGVDLSYYALLGKMPEVEYALGENPDVITKELNARLKEENDNHKEDPNHAHEHDEDEFYFEVVQGEKNVLLDNGHICYYYNKANKNKGISYIVNYDTAYGLSLGKVISEVKDEFSSVEFKEEPISSNNAFFADYIVDGTVLTATFGENVVLFVFQENALFATAIYNSNWSN